MLSQNHLESPCRIRVPVPSTHKIWQGYERSNRQCCCISWRLAQQHGTRSILISHTIEPTRSHIPCDTWRDGPTLRLKRTARQESPCRVRTNSSAGVPKTSLAFGGMMANHTYNLGYAREWERRRSLQPAVLLLLSESDSAQWDQLYSHPTVESDGTAKITTSGMEQLK